MKETTEQDLGNTRSPETETENQNPAKVESKRILIIGITFINTWNRLDTPKTRSEIDRETSLSVIGQFS